MLTIVIAALAGAVTVAAPCTLPVLPILLGASVAQTSNVRPLFIALGFVTSFSVVAIAFGTITQILGVDRIDGGPGAVGLYVGQLRSDLRRIAMVGDRLATGKVLPGFAEPARTASIILDRLPQRIDCVAPVSSSEPNGEDETEGRSNGCCSAATRLAQPRNRQHGWCRSCIGRTKPIARSRTAPPNALLKHSNRHVRMMNMLANVIRLISIAVALLAPSHLAKAADQYHGPVAGRRLD